MLDRLHEVITLDLFVGAVFGALVSAAFAVFWKSFGAMLQRRPINSVLGDIADRNQECLILLRHLYGINDTGGRVARYRCDLPDPMPPRTSDKYEEVINTPFVLSKADVQAATDVLNVIGQVGKKENITVSSVYSAWSKWDKPMVLIGGTKKAEVLLSESASPAIRLLGSGDFSCLQSNQHFEARNGNDYGLIMKTRHRDTGKTHLLIMGVGVMGTEAAGYYLRAHAGVLGKMYGRREFAVIVHTDIKKGHEGASPCYFAPAPAILKRILHPFIWFRCFRNARHRTGPATTRTIEPK